MGKNKSRLQSELAYFFVREYVAQTRLLVFFLSFF